MPEFLFLWVSCICLWGPVSRELLEGIGDDFSEGV